MKVDLKSAQVVLLPAKRKSFRPTGIPKAVRKAGFTPGKVQVTVVGTLGRENSFLRLDMPGPVKQFILAAGAKAEELEKQPDLLGRRLRVTGLLQASHADKPPGLTVETWESLSNL